MNQPNEAQSSTETPPPRNVGSIPITRSPSQNATPAGKPGKDWEKDVVLIAHKITLLIYELVDATDEERYHPLGLYFTPDEAMRAAEAHHPGRWEPILDTQAVAEVRARKLGTSGGDYAVLWRGEWHYDYDAGGEWKLVEQQLGTLEKPLPITRP